MTQAKDLTGKRVGKLTYLKKSERKGPLNQIMWLSQCDCGKLVDIIPNNSRVSCGCARVESIREAKKRYRKSLLELPTNNPKQKRVKFNRLEHCTRRNHGFLCQNYMACLDNKAHRKEQLASGSCYLATVDELRFEAERFSSLTRVCELVA